MSYLLAFGPVVWLSMRLDPVKHQRTLRVLGLSYQPVVIAIAESPAPMKYAVEECLQFGAPHHIHVTHGIDRGLFWQGPGYTYTFLSY
ncbi:MAG: hypothetical protein KDA86_02450 [Planctomycetaceae bacterium]|nr:hypothetical protein [Planctomycetaceae bacterium]